MTYNPTRERYVCDGCAEVSAADYVPDNWAEVPCDKIGAFLTLCPTCVHNALLHVSAHYRAKLNTRKATAAPAPKPIRFREFL